MRTSLKKTLAGILVLQLASQALIVSAKAKKEVGFQNVFLYIGECDLFHT